MTVRFGVVEAAGSSPVTQTMEVMVEWCLSVRP